MHYKTVAAVFLVMSYELLGFRLETRAVIKLLLAWLVAVIVKFGDF